MRLRAFESMLLLFRIEQLKRFVVGSVRATTAFGASSGDAQAWSLKRAVEFLVESRVIDATDAQQLARLVSYRNIVAHELHEIARDVGQFAEPELGTAYQSDALRRLTELEEKIEARLAKGFIMSVSLAPLWFDAARRTYEGDIARLRKRIRRRAEAQSRLVGDANRIIRNLPAALVRELGNPARRQRNRNGTLTQHGRRLVDCLYAEGATPFVVAHLMKLSLRTARRYQPHGLPVYDDKRES